MAQILRLGRNNRETGPTPRDAATGQQSGAQGGGEASKEVGEQALDQCPERLGVNHVVNERKDETILGPGLPGHESANHQEALVKENHLLARAVDEFGAGAKLVGLVGGEKARQKVRGEALDERVCERGCGRELHVG